MSENSNHAIVYGASGLIGWALVNELLGSYPHAGSFSKVTAITNRRLELSETYWPEPNPHQPELQLVSGIDLRGGDGASLAVSLKRGVKDVENVTHVYYVVFAAMEDDIEEVATNRWMFQSVVDAHNMLSPHLRFVAFPGGTRGYGIYAPGGTFTPPLTEDMVDKLPVDYAKTVVYPTFRELLKAASEGKKWTWCEFCPDVIIGFTPKGSQFSLALHWAQYLSLYAHNNGVGSHSYETNKPAVEAPFPGNAASAKALFSPVSSKTLARFMIYASTHPATCGKGRLFNVADNEKPCTLGEIWPQLANWFGLVGVGPAESGPDQKKSLKAGELPPNPSLLSPGEYVAEHKGVFEQCGRTNAAGAGVGAGNQQLDSVGYWLTFDRQLSVKKLRKTGFERNKEPTHGWLESFEMFRKAGLIL